jgi:tetratricopeptide (TPR) repeat protein
MDMSQDYYETLQVHPKADQDAITAAYARLCELYDPAKLDGAAEELSDLARQRRDAIERAFAVLGDPTRRAAYDAEQAAPAHEQQSTSNDQRPQLGSRPGSRSGTLWAVLSSDDHQKIPDYRPLPPARRAERARDFDAYPVRQPPAGRQAARKKTSRWTAPLALGGLLVLIVAISLGMTGGGASPATPPAAGPTPTPSPLDAFEAEIPAAKQIAEQNPNDPRAWIDYGNILYNSAEIVRENAPESTLYEQRLPRWLEATQAYSRALTLDPGNASVRGDLGVSACFYGVGKSDQTLVRVGISEARRAAHAAPDDARVLLNLGHCLVSAQPPQSEEAIAQWRRAVEVAPPGSPLATQAQQLISQYSQ